MNMKSNPILANYETSSRTRNAVRVIAILCAAAAPCLATIVTYPAPSGAALATRFAVTVNGTALSVYNAQVNDPLNCSFAQFDMAVGDMANIVVTVPATFTSCKIRPASSGVTATASGNEIRFTLTKPAKLAITLNGNLDNPFFLFANPPEAAPPSQSDPNVRYFAAGIHNNPGTITLSSNQAVYLAGGAYITGSCLFRAASGARNITVRGRGIIDRHSASGAVAQINGARSVLFEGITVTDQPTMNWCMTFTGCDSVLVENIKQMNGDHWSNDGVNFVSSQYCTINDCFIKTYDDCITIKGMSNPPRDVIHITATNCFLWDEWAHGVCIGAELRNCNVNNITYRNIDIVKRGPCGGDNYHSALGIYNGDNAIVSNVRYEDIRAELFDDCRQLINFNILNSTWSTTASRGWIRDIYFKNVNLIDDGGMGWTNILSGYDASHKVINLTFENLVIKGQSITNLTAGHFQVSNADSIRFITTSAQRMDARPAPVSTTWMRAGADHGILRISIDRPGAHAVAVMNATGALVHALRGTGPRTYRCPAADLGAGVHFVNAQAGIEHAGATIIINEGP